MSIDGKQRAAGKQSRALAITQAMRLHFLSSTTFPNSTARWGPSFPTTRAYEKNSSFSNQNLLMDHNLYHSQPASFQRTFPMLALGIFSGTQVNLHAWI